MKERIRTILDQRMSKDIGLPKIRKAPKKNPEAVKKRQEHRSGIDPEDVLSRFDGAIVKQAIIDLN